MTLNSAEQESIHRFCFANRELLDRSDRAGCFYCEALFDPAEITGWTDRPPVVGGTPNGATAKCPKCGIDAVLPSAAPINLTQELLAEMKSFWFRGL